MDDGTGRGRSGRGKKVEMGILSFFDPRIERGAFGEEGPGDMDGLMNGGIATFLFVPPP